MSVSTSDWITNMPAPERSQPVLDDATPLAITWAYANFGTGNIGRQPETVYNPAGQLTPVRIAFLSIDGLSALLGTQSSANAGRNGFNG
jgi:hypothetical protein